MITRATAICAAALLLLAPVASHAALTSYSQDFELLNMADPNALASDGWVVYGNVFTTAHVYVYGYGTYPAPNGGSAFCSVDALQGGIPQGQQQLSIYSDYNNLDHANPARLIESNVFHEQTISAADLHTTWTFQFDAKMGNLVAPSTALAFIKTIDPAHGYAMTNYIPIDMTAIPATWGTFSISIPLDSLALTGQLLQFGFSNTAAGYVGSGVFYDNLSWTKTATSGVGTPNRANALELRPAAPNPFHGTTRMDFAMTRTGAADLSVFDVGGRRTVTLFHGEAGAGPHSANWDGRTADGRLAPAGVYHAVLRTSEGTVTRSIVLSR